MITYDQSKKIYRWWSFMSNGMASESKATWDSKNKAMTRITHYGDITQTATSNFSKPGLESWTIVNMDKDKKVISKMVNTRRKE